MEFLRTPLVTASESPKHDFESLIPNGAMTIVLDYVEAIQSYEANSKDHYIAACKQCGVTPASYYIRNMKNIRLNMAHHGLGEKGVKALTMSLMVIKSEIYFFVKHLPTISHKISETFLCFSIVSMELGNYHQKLNVRVAQRVAERLKIIRKLRKLKKTAHEVFHYGFRQ